MNISIRRQAGATLVEIIMVVALIAIITIGSFLYFNAADNGAKVKAAMSSLESITTIIQNQFATSTNYTGLTEAVVRNSGGVSSNLASSTAGHLKHPWSQVAAAVGISVNPAAVPVASSFMITFTLVPQGACVDLAGKSINKFSAITINGTPVVNASTPGTSCSSSTSNTMVFTSN